MEERLLSTEDTMKVIDSSVKENIKSNKILTGNMNTMKRPNLGIISIEEREVQLKSTENIFNKIIVENFPNLKKDIPMKIQEAYKTPNKLDQKKIQNNERILGAVKKKGLVTYKGKPIRITHDFSLETLKARRSWSSIMQTLRNHGCQPHPRTTIPRKTFNQHKQTK